MGPLRGGAGRCGIDFISDYYFANSWFVAPRSHHPHYLLLGALLRNAVKQLTAGLGS